MDAKSCNFVIFFCLLLTPPADYIIIQEWE